MDKSRLLLFWNDDQLPLLAEHGHIQGILKQALMTKQQGHHDYNQMDGSLSKPITLASLCKTIIYLSNGKTRRKLSIVKEIPIEPIEKKRARILLIDDNQSNILVAQMMLSAQYDVVSAENGLKGGIL
jgi:hypothetical protein